MSPNDTHYVAALLLASESGCVSVECGPWMYNKATKSRRDVDIVSTIQPSHIEESFLCGLEVKGHQRPLSSDQVDGLIRKLQDTPAIQKRGVISASGFARPALEACSHHGIRAYTLRDWDPNNDHFGVCLRDLRTFDAEYSEWLEPAHVRIDVDIDPQLAIRAKPCMADGSLRDDIRSFNELGAFVAQSLVGSLPQHVQDDIKLGWPRALNVRIEEKDLYLKYGRNIFKVEGVTVTGRLVHRKVQVPITFKELVVEKDQTPILACGCAVIPTGQLYATIVSTERGYMRIGHISSITRSRRKVFKVKLT